MVASTLLMWKGTLNRGMSTARYCTVQNYFGQEACVLHTSKKTLPRVRVYRSIYYGVNQSPVGNLFR